MSGEEQSHRDAVQLAGEGRGEHTFKLIHTHTHAIVYNIHGIRRLPVLLTGLVLLESPDSMEAMKLLLTPRRKLTLTCL